MRSKSRSSTSSAKRATTSRSTPTQSLFSRPSPQPWKPEPYMLKSVRFLLQHACGALLLDPGLRKTSITLGAVKILKEKGLLNKVLVIAPLRVCHSVWPEEIIKWKDFSGLRCVVLHGPKKDQLLEEDADLYLINPEGLEWLLDVTKVKNKRGRTVVTVNMKRWKKLGFDTLVIDELTKFKNHQANRFKAMKQVLRTFARRWGLTGSPASNGLMGLFGQMYMLDMGNALGQYITHYRLKYFELDRNGFSWNLRPGAEDEIYERIQPLSLRLAADDYIKIPKEVPNIIYVDLPDKARRVYDELEKKMISYLDSGRSVSAAVAGAKFGKCRQVASGAVFIDQEVKALVKLPTSKKEWVELHDAKIDALHDLIEELQGSPLLLAYEYSHDLIRIQEAIKDMPVLDSNVKRSKGLIEAWNRGELPYLAVHPMSGGHGLNLQEQANHVGFFTPTPDYEMTDQFIRRVRRSGNTRARVFVHYFVARGTVEQKIVMPLLSGKQAGQEALFQALKKMQKR